LTIEFSEEFPSVRGGFYFITAIDYKHLSFQLLNVIYFNPFEFVDNIFHTFNYLLKFYFFLHWKNVNGCQPNFNKNLQW
jgi:hypothetical protein